MNLIVLFEVILVVSAFVSLLLMRRTYFPMNLFWGVGVVSIGLAALLGAFVYGGYAAVKPYHNLASTYAGSVGIVSFMLAAVGGVFAQQFHRAGWWIVLIAITTLSALLLFDMWRLSEEVRYGVVGVFGLAGLYRVMTNPNPGVFLFIGIAALVAAGLVSGWLASQVGMERLNIYHLLLSLSILSFGVFAAKE